MPKCKLISLQCLLAFLILSIQSGWTQNLVPNHDFDHYLRCPDGRGEIKQAAPWYTPNLKTTDFAHQCAGDGFAGIPENNWGSAFPTSGRGYAGIRTWLDPDRSGENYREYLAVELTDSLEAGVAYFVSFNVSVGDSAMYTSDDLGLYISHDTIPNLNVLPFEPQIAQEEGQIISLATGWRKISGQYIAVGGEKHIVIGNFKNDQETTLLRRNVVEGVATTYFYIDEVIIEPCAPRFPEELLLASDTAFCPGGSVELKTASDVSFARFEWENNTQDSVRTISTPGIYSLTTTIFGCSRTDSIEITEAPIPIVDLGADTLLCPGERLLLVVADTIDAYTWENGTSSSNRWIEEAGIYSLTTSLGACSSTDEIIVDYEETYLGESLVDTIICLGTSITLEASVAEASFRWSDNSEQSSLTINQPGNFYVDIQTKCLDVREDFFVAESDCGCTSFVPNVFTPNGDGIHDEFRPAFRQGISDLLFQVFDRMGRLMFETRDPNQFWSGLYGQKHVAEGVYYWAVQYNCYEAGAAKRQRSTGHVTLLR